jgi:hypothetical protein
VPQAPRPLTAFTRAARYEWLFWNGALPAPRLPAPCGVDRCRDRSHTVGKHVASVRTGTIEMAYPSAQLRGSVGPAAGSAAPPFAARAAATTSTVRRVQGFIPAEGAALKAMIADHEQQSGDTVELTTVPFAPMRQREIAAVTSGVAADPLARCRG